MQNVYRVAAMAFAATVATPICTAAAPSSKPDRPALIAEHARACAGKDGWSDPAPPVPIFGNVYDVGSCGITVLLVTGPEGHILIDAGPAEASAVVLGNIVRLRFKPKDVKLILSTHEHVDHAGGLNLVKRATGARLLASAAAKSTLESGTMDPSDPQAEGLKPYKGVQVDGVVRDGEVVSVGPLRLTAHLTPAHAPGSTSWSWTSCERGACHAVVYADSFSAVSSGDYRFSAHPDYVKRFRASLARLGGLSCDLLITPHPEASDLYARLEGKAPLVDASACKAYAARSTAKLDERLAKEAN